jgi:hypothetical protein
MTPSVLRLTLMAGSLAIGASAFAQPRTITTDDYNSRIWSKVASERAKGNATKSRLSLDDIDGRCGSLEIGNVNTGGSRRAAPREVITVITGDVINAPGRCK